MPFCKERRERDEQRWGYLNNAHTAGVRFPGEAARSCRRWRE